MIRRVLVANRGAIAVRIIRTLKELDIEAVCVFSEADRDSLHVSDADLALYLGHGSAAETYLDKQKLIDLALQNNCHAIHPGYGFLSENAEFVEACEQAGLHFLGPTAEQIRAFGLKHRARDIAQQNGVPLLPGTGVLKDLNEALEQAEKIGYPVMLKSSAGGGGIGMTLCYDEDELNGAWQSVLTLSQNNFGSAELFLEKFVERARHIEVQIFGDGEGKVITLGERDCSMQRRNQKVIEEAPAPNLPEATRSAMLQTSVELASSVKYRSAGTVEYIYDDLNDAYYFLEVNTRLQVEHGVTEQIFAVDLVAWMVQLAKGEFAIQNYQGLQANGHSIQVRVYAENPSLGFQPSSGLISQLVLPEQSEDLRIDHWLSKGIEVSALYDPMLAKVIVTAENRNQAFVRLSAALDASEIYGLETNLDYLRQLLELPDFKQGKYITATLKSFEFASASMRFLSGGTLTMIQDLPGRTGYWDVGVPPSGPFDDKSFRIGNQLLGNAPDAAGLEITLQGPSIEFACKQSVVITGGEADCLLDGQKMPVWQPFQVAPGQVLEIGRVANGARAYLLVSGGIQCPDYLGSKSTFTLGQFGGHNGRALRAGDVLHLDGNAQLANPSFAELNGLALPKLSETVTEVRVIPGPHGAPDFFKPQYIDDFYATTWEVHFNSSRTGVRLIGPKPQWARETGGEAGMHPSNLHDNAYAVGSIDFTGDMPVILGPDGPSLGGFVCPATIISADLHKVGQLSPGDRLKFVPVSQTHAVQALRELNDSIKQVSFPRIETNVGADTEIQLVKTSLRSEPVLIRPAGDSNILVEIGEPVLSIRLRFLIHQLMQTFADANIEGVRELTPGIRSLQIHYDCLVLTQQQVIESLKESLVVVEKAESQRVPSRIVHLPLSWDDEQCRLAIEKYHISVRENAPWYPSNLEFIRRINGLASIEEVKDIVFSANYLVMGLGDVYLGAPVATPVNPKHRLVTTKYNPARTWTAENSVGIGGSYLCIYGMEGPGGYQFVGRTLQMWNRYKQTNEFSKPWLLRFFDQIKFYPVTEQELTEIRRDFPHGRYPIKVEETEFDLLEYEAKIVADQAIIDDFKNQRTAAYDAELADWKANGQYHFEPTQVAQQDDEELVPESMQGIESPVAGSVWQVLVEPGQNVKAGDKLLVLESMKMEIEITAPSDGVLNSLRVERSGQVLPGMTVAWLEPSNEV
jgi:urea carboxylase